VRSLNEVYSSLSTRRRYEVWFLRLGLADNSSAWWFRYLLLNPGEVVAILPSFQIGIGLLEIVNPQGVIECAIRVRCRRRSGPRGSLAMGIHKLSFKVSRRKHWKSVRVEGVRFTSGPVKIVSKKTPAAEIWTSMDRRFPGTPATIRPSAQR
jgi:hypothetical protein